MAPRLHTICQKELKLLPRVTFVPLLTGVQLQCNALVPLLHDLRSCTRNTRHNLSCSDLTCSYRHKFTCNLSSVTPSLSIFTLNSPTLPAPTLLLPSLPSLHPLPFQICYLAIFLSFVAIATECRCEKQVAVKPLPHSGGNLLFRGLTFSLYCNCT